MLRKRIIFTLIYSDGFFTQSRNFRLQKVGNLGWLEKNYNFKSVSSSIDELIILDASKSKKSIFTFADNISRLVDNVFIPVAAGGGIRTLEDAKLLFNSGADKIVINSILVENPELVNALVQKYGTQSIIASVDYKNNNGTLEVYINDGNFKLNMSLRDYIKYIESLEVGEIYFNSIDKDGTGFGYDFEIIKMIVQVINLPIIISGGAGNENHLAEGLKMTGVSAVATANLFNFIGNGLPNARAKIINDGENIATWDNI